MPSPQVDRALKALGSQIQIARKKRRIPVKEFAARIGVSEGTAIRLESGEPGVRIETLAMAMMALGELDRLKSLLDPADDDSGLLLEQSRLPRRIDKPRRNRSSQEASHTNPDESDEGTAF